MMRSASIRSKLMQIAMATTCASLVLLAGAWGAFEFVSYRRAMITEMATVHEIIRANSTAALAFEDEAGAKEILAALKPLADVRLGCVFDAKGRPLASFERGGERERCPSSPMPDGISLADGVLSQTSAVMLDDERVGTLQLVASQTKLWTRLRLSALVLAVAFAAATLAAYLLSSRLQRLVSRPILDLATTAGHISERRDYTLRAPQHSTDEVGVAVGAFNHMLDRIQDADRALRDASQQSRQQAQFLASILDNMGEGLVVIDQRGEVLVWNAAAKRIVGPSPQGIGLEQWPRHLGVRRHPDQTPLDAGELPLARALRGEAVTDQQLYLEPTAAPRARWVNASARPLRDEQGKLLGAISVFRDISLQKQAELELKASEAQLRQSQKMDAVGQLAGGIAHDFNNLLTAICGYGSFAHELLPPEHPARKDIEEVLSAAERAATLTHQLLAFSRKQVLAPRLLDLNVALRASEQMLRRLIGENIELSVLCGANLGRVRADPGQLDQVILNLALNARDAMPRGGRLRIQTSNVQLQVPPAPDQAHAPVHTYTRLTVTDTGVGMSEAVQARIFEPFFTTKAPGKGTGLGLSTVYGIVQQSGGHISVSSREGAGTTFDVYLPCSEIGAADSVAPPSTGTAMSRGSETILLAEDEEQVRNLAQAILTKLGYQVLAARDGVEALELQARYAGPIHLLITDVVMPRMSGGELAERLLERVPSLRILFVSGYTADTRLSSHLPAGELTLISKPFTAELLALKTREVLDQALEKS
jgi:two-component system cell cycle sensor histidine kinase/response regulator CckA